MKIVVSHPTGNQFVRALINELSEKGMLEEFHTSLAVNPDASWLKLMPVSIRQECLRRSYPVAGNLVHTHPLLELARLILPRFGLQRFTQHEVGKASVDAVYRKIDKDVAKRLCELNDKKPDGVYCYEDGAEFTFEAAKHLGIKRFYDLPIGYWKAARAYLQHEQERWPDWAVTLPGFKDSDEKLARKDHELALADKIFVASSFTKSTLSYFSGDLPQVDVIPYGFPPVDKERTYSVNFFANKPLKLIFVGGLSQRKGIADVFEAVKGLEDKIQLTIIGNKAVENCKPLNEALAKHHWIPSLPHQQILKIMKEHDVLLFPSLFEGFGLVISEAMAQGTPVITTERTAGADFINNGENGWLINAGNTAALREAIENILHNPKQLESVSKAAIETARKRPWQAYATELVSALIKNN